MANEADANPVEGSTVRQRRPETNDLNSNGVSSTTNDSNNNSKSLPYSNTSEYCKELNKWMVQHFQWQCLQQMSFQMAMSTVQGNASLTSTSPRPLAATMAPNVANNLNNNESGRIYLLPKIWKRVLAELIDFLVLLVLKVLVTYVAIDTFELVDMDKYGVNIMEEDFDPYQLAYELTSEILIIECIHRLLVVGFETFCLAKAQGTNRIGGATPGKTLLGLKVVSCSHVDDLGNGTIRVTAANDIGYLWALLRSLIKNLSSVFFLPASLTIFVSSHNRAAYDIACKCIVVENIPVANPRNVN
ncbi:Protein FAM8A1 [Halotydeus destructor]|nr:Protein FAM8A1 [Halotydeus destructor]